MTNHPIIACFGDTLGRTFPLVLVVGREPNAGQVIADEVGKYDFRAYPKCAFWNTSYSVIARTAGMSVVELKRHSVERNGSPVVYADASPHCIENSKSRAAKMELRTKLAAEQAAHVEAIFSHGAVVDRVGIVIMSGLEHPSFEIARESIQRKCEQRGVICQRVPFFYPTNTAKIQQQLSPESAERIRFIVQQFGATVA